ncbi:MAG: cupin domain-containing protein [Candidatus Omnitrophota bacterium]
MDTIFPLSVTNLPQADISLEGVTAYVAQGENYQIIFSKYTKDAYIPEHMHESQWGVVLEGKIEFRINATMHIYTKGDRYFIPKGIAHSSNVYAGYADIIFFNEKDRFRVKKT